MWYSVKHIVKWDNQTIVLATLWLAVNSAYAANSTLKMPVRHWQEEDSAIKGKSGFSLKTELEWTYAFNPSQENEPQLASKM